jgi:hypothetical protein
MVVFAIYYVADDSTLTPTSGQWHTVSDPNALRGTVKYTVTTGGSLEWTFNGSRVAYLHSMAYNRGAVIVSVDGTVVDKLDAYTPEVRRQIGKVYDGFSDSQHTIRIENKGGGANNRTVIDVDAFVSDIMSFPPGTYNDDAKLIIGGVTYYPLGFFGYNWSRVYDGGAYGGSYYKTDATGAGIRINFFGDSIYWFFPRRSDLGMIAITIDGENKGERDPYADGTNYYSLSRLGAGSHILTITNLGYGSSGGTVLALDRFDVGSYEFTYNRVMATAYADAWARSQNSTVYGYFPNNDCANFSSQMQHEGGIPMHPDPLHANEHDLTQWWNYYPFPPYNISLTWKTVPDFWTYVQTYPGFQIFDHAQYDIDILKRGDVIFMDQDNNGVFDHLKVVAGYGYMSPYSEDYNPLQDWSTQLNYGVMTDGHTTARWHVLWDYAYTSYYPTKFVKVTPP